MFDPTSRYAAIETATLTDADGRVIAYERRRFLPPGAACRCSSRSRWRRAIGST